MTVEDLTIAGVSMAVFKNQSFVDWMLDYCMYDNMNFVFCVCVWPCYVCDCFLWAIVTVEFGQSCLSNKIEIFVLFWRTAETYRFILRFKVVAWYAIGRNAACYMSSVKLFLLLFQMEVHRRLQYQDSSRARMCWMQARGSEKSSVHAAADNDAIHITLFKNIIQIVVTDCLSEWLIYSGLLMVDRCWWEGRCSDI